jgi:hypothetical protein
LNVLQLSSPDPESVTVGGLALDFQFTMHVTPNLGILDRQVTLTSQSMYCSLIS